MKKLISLVLVLALALSIVSFASAEDKVTINLTRCTFNLVPDEDQVKKVEAAINEYIADKINVEVKITEISSGEYTEKVNKALANAGEINLLWTASWEAVIGTNDLVPLKAVYDITDLLPGTALYESMAEGQWAASSYNGRNYFVPVYKDNVEGYDLLYRKAALDGTDFDVTSVKKLADVEPFLEAAYNAGLKYPFLLQKTAMFYRFGMDDFYFFTGDANSNWVAVSAETNEVVNTIQTPQYLEYCKLMADWAEKGYISDDEANKLTTDTTTQSQDWGVTWWTDIPVNAEAETRYQQAVVVNPLTQRYVHSTSNLGSCYCVTATSTEEQAKACIDFLGLLFTDSKLADMYTFGIEGEDFEYVKEFTDADGNVFGPYEKDHVHTLADKKYNHGMWESASATVVTPEYNEPDNKAELYLDFNGSAATAPGAGFRFDKAPVEAAYEACKNLFNEYGFLLETGGVPAADVEAKIAEYQEKLDGAHYQEVLAEFQKQYTEWKAAQ
ncbi:MAG: ABC transporter substrate-binding protein [Clostridiales bacterium]|nr:ABC transporter substrate-binding protein [Clostridiales bacterium]